MNQPDLGLKVAELRLQKGLTQERLAELCEVSLRTIQRIEGGEVDPRAYTLHCLGTALDFDFGEPNTTHESLWLAGLHLGGALNLILTPLVLWLWKRSQSYRIDQQGREVLNFVITMKLIQFGGLAVMLVVEPLIFLLMITMLMATQQEAWNWLWVPLAIISVADVFLFLVMAVFCLLQGTMNLIRSLNGKPTHYALSIPFVT